MSFHFKPAGSAAKALSYQHNYLSGSGSVLGSENLGPVKQTSPSSDWSKGNQSYLGRRRHARVASFNVNYDLDWCFCKLSLSQLGILVGAAFKFLLWKVRIATKHFVFSGSHWTTFCSEDSVYVLFWFVSCLLVLVWATTNTCLTLLPDDKLCPLKTSLRPHGSLGRTSQVLVPMQTNFSDSKSCTCKCSGQNRHGCLLRAKFHQTNVQSGKGSTVTESLRTIFKEWDSQGVNKVWQGCSCGNRH